MNGFVVPTYSVDAIKEQILQIKSSPDQAREMGVAARATAMNNTWLHYSEKLLKVYDELV